MTRVQELQERSDWVESEYEKWNGNFEIPFDKEFEVKAILALQHQFERTEDAHVKTKADILHMITTAKRDLKLKPKEKSGLPEGVKVITSEIGYTLRDQNIKFIKEINSRAIDSNDLTRITTKMFYKNNGKVECVEDYSPFANEKYMSKGLLESLANGTTLTTQQEAELMPFIIESRSF